MNFILRKTKQDTLSPYVILLDGDTVGRVFHTEGKRYIFRPLIGTADITNPPDSDYYHFAKGVESDTLSGVTALIRTWFEDREALRQTLLSSFRGHTDPLPLPEFEVNKEALPINMFNVDLIPMANNSMSARVKLHPGEMAQLLGYTSTELPYTFGNVGKGDKTYGLKWEYYPGQEWIYLKTYAGQWVMKVKRSDKHRESDRKYR